MPHLPRLSLILPPGVRVLLYVSQHIGSQGTAPSPVAHAGPVQTRQVKIRDKPFSQRDLIEKHKVEIPPPDPGQRLFLGLKVNHQESSSSDHLKSSNLSSTMLGKVI